MKQKGKLKSKINSLLYNHLWLKSTVDWVGALFLSAVSAAIFAFGLVVFLKPVGVGNEMVSGGASGFSQTLVLLFKVLKIDFLPENVIYSIFYILLNTPLVILAFKGVGKRFAVFTLVNVLFVALFTNIFTATFFINLATYIQENAGMLGRALFAGLCTGISSAIAFKIDSSAGGLDILSYYISLKRGNNTGPYGAAFNIAILLFFAVLTGINSGGWDTAIGGLFFSIVYLFTVMLLIDLINVRNKKAQIEIVTSDENLSTQLLAYVPHGATIIKGKGVYSGNERFVILMVVSINEVKRVVKVVKELEPESFVNVSVLQQVYGRFHMKPIK